MQLVAIDIGGTHARFAVATIGVNGTVNLGEVRTLPTRDHPSFDAAWQAFATQNGGAMPTAAAISIAGPVGDPSDDSRVIRWTNNPWTIQPAALREKLGLTALTLVNDFAAVAHAVASVAEDQFLPLAGPDGALPAEGTISVVGPGTGLGVGYLWRGKGGYRVQATEGGHLDFPPLDAFEDALLARLRTRHRRVSQERVVSGPGLVDIYETLAAQAGKAIVPGEADKAIWQRGLAGEDQLASDAIDRFCLSLGSAAGDLALAQGASGVVIAGGLGLRLKDRLPASGFASRFCAKGRFEAMMAAIPVRLIIHPQPGLLGAAAAFAQEHRQQMAS